MSTSVSSVSTSSTGEETVVDSLATASPSPKITSDLVASKLEPKSPDSAKIEELAPRVSSESEIQEKGPPERVRNTSRRPFRKLAQSLGNKISNVKIFSRNQEDSDADSDDDCITLIGRAPELKRYSGVCGAVHNKHAEKRYKRELKNRAAAIKRNKDIQDREQSSAEKPGSLKA